MADGQCGYSRSSLTVRLAAVTDDGQIERYGLNAVCTHLGCVVRLQLTPAWPKHARTCASNL